MNEKTTQLLDGTFCFGVNILKFLNKLPYSQVYKVPILQLSRSSTSVGANYEEAQGATSKRDFNYKIGISYREARESAYWLRVLKELYIDEKFTLEFEQYKDEANELKKIFASIKISSSK
ncbi:four helix bundle protein [Pedobacter frigiditerrae]|uniref:Four helix bundle protein n=1 Tax=Pedobacter frigiditerrae TaxID=2530452 RepID=A0A4R0MYE0_9SPHI|nr:four helix bundle protein [Pedobacter frigiditerrae]TCC92341.1 four helix bundle protein [Pedobacter frigiditerrae]